MEGAGNGLLPSLPVVGGCPVGQPKWRNSSPWPRYCSRLSRSASALPQVMPFFGLFFLMGELTLNDCSKRKKMLRLAMQQQAMQKPSAAQ